MKSQSVILLLGMLFASLAPLSIAQAEDRPKGDHPRPPREALEACKGKSSGTECQFKGRQDTVKGKCWSPDSSKPLACKPDHMPEHESGHGSEKKPEGHRGGESSQGQET